MNERTLRNLDRALERLDRDSRRPRRRFPISAIYLTLALVLGYQLLVRFVPMVWSSLLPGGLAQASNLPGWAGLLWRMGVYCHNRFAQVSVTIAVVSVLGFVLGRGPWLPRLLVWLAAVGVVLMDAGIVLIAIKTSMDATLQDAGAF